MTRPGPTDPQDGPELTGDAWLAGLLTELADDPDAPPSVVSSLSVIAAAKRAAAASSAADDEGATAPLSGPGDADPGAQSAAAAHGDAGDAVTPIDRRRRRRTFLTGLVAAACIFGVGVVVVPSMLDGGSSVTSTSADANRIAEAAPNPSAAVESEAAGLAREAPPEGQENAEIPSQADSGLADSGPADAGALAGCWPALPGAAAVALAQILPAGAFGGAAPLTEGCDPAGVSGAVLSGGVPDVALVVRVTTATPGACTGTAGCVPVDDGTYVGADAAGALVAYAYGNGYQVAVGGVTSQATAGSGLTESQAAAAAQAVLASLQ